jgi:hypothetical protein
MHHPATRLRFGPTRTGLRVAASAEPDLSSLDGPARPCGVRDRLGGVPMTYPEPLLPGDTDAHYFSKP